VNMAVTYHAVLFRSVNQTMWGEKLLKAAGIPHKLIPVPRQISSDCGVCLRIESEYADAARRVLEGIDGFVDIVSL
jgi:hypothetical protein